MHATIRRYEGVDQNRTTEVTRKVNETLVPQLSKLQGFKGYYMIESGNGVFSSLGLFERPEQIEESTKLASSWVRDEKLETALPNPPLTTLSSKVTTRRLPRAASRISCRSSGFAKRALMTATDQPSASSAEAASSARITIGPNPMNNRSRPSRSVSPCPTGSVTGSIGGNPKPGSRG